MTTPFALIDLPAFLNGFGTQAAAFGATVSVAPKPSWLIYVEAPEAGPLAGRPSLLAAGGLGIDDLPRRTPGRTACAGRSLAGLSRPCTST
ncbi:MAG: hypothetical protein MZV64_13810 [Ignavibacteriales bacterium]|nr:hypothetical protein [Ignavibacteriales bacterium]